MPRPLVPSPINELNERSREIFRLIVDGYVATGEPIGSRTLSRRLGQNLSPATIRNVMADLEEAGLLYAPHTSAGRLPTELGLRLFVHGLLEIGGLADLHERHVLLDHISRKQRPRCLACPIAPASSWCPTRTDP